MENKGKPPRELDSIELLELVCQLHSRSTQFATKELHLGYMEARMELENRIINDCHIPPPPKICDCGAYHTRRHLLDNKCAVCKKKITN